MEGQLNCPLCQCLYRESNVPRLLTMCGHTFCEKCIKTIMFSRKKDGKFRIQCPEDGCTMDFATNKITQFPKNIVLLNAVQRRNKRKSKSVVPFYDESSLNQIHPIKESEESTENLQFQGNEFLSLIDSRISLPCSTQNPFKISIAKHLDSQCCLLHQKPFELICIEHAEKICVNCALFGQHKGHTFKGFNDIQKQADKCSNELKSLLVRKRSRQDKYSQVSERSYLSEQIQRKTDSMKKQIRLHCDYMMQKLRAVQMKGCEDIDKITQKTNQQMTKWLNEKENNAELADWDIKVLNVLATLQSSVLQKKISLLFDKGALSNELSNLRNTGENLLLELENDENAPREQLRRYLDKFEIQLNPRSLPQLQKLFSFTQCELFQENSFHNRPKNIISVAADKFTLNNHLFKDKQCLISQIFDEYEEQSLLDDPSSINTIKTLHSPPSGQQKLQSSIIHNAMKTSMCSQGSKSINDFYLNSLKKKRKTSYFPVALKQEPKRKISKFKLPEKYEKAIQGLKNNSIQVVDLTGAQLGDDMITGILGYFRNSKVKALKLIRNQITDDCFEALLQNIESVVSLNISQNQLTEKSLAYLLQNLQNLPNLKTVVLTQNKIVERKNRNSLEKLRSYGLIITL